MDKTKRKPFIWEALLSFGFLIMCMAIGILWFEQAPHMPMLLGTAFAAIMAARLGYKWQEIEDAMFQGILQAMQAIIILAIIGVLIGVWIQAGIVPTMIYYGLKLLSPKIFLVAAVLIASITSLATGTSWGTMGTVGVALIGVAEGLGVPLPIAAGAIISGAYFGDKMSPLSDTTNLAPAMAGTDVFTHVKFMIRPTIISYAITLVFFGVVGSRFGSDSADLGSVTAIAEGIQSVFKVSPLLMIPPILVITLIAFKMPAIPGISIGIISGAILGMIFQGATFGDMLNVGYNGYSLSADMDAIKALLSTEGIGAASNVFTGKGLELLQGALTPENIAASEGLFTKEALEALADLMSNPNFLALKKLLTAGGLSAMFFSISLTIFAMMFGGIMEKTGQLEVIVQKLVSIVKSPRGLLVLTMFTCLMSNATMPEQYISLVLPGRMYAAAYRERGLHPKMLSNALESSGTILSPLVPWNTCGAFIVSVLKVETLVYAPWAIFNYVTPLIVFLLSFPGWTVATIESDPDTVITR